MHKDCPDCGVVPAQVLPPHRAQAGRGEKAPPEWDWGFVPPPSCASPHML